MTRTQITCGVFATVFVLIALGVGYLVFQQRAATPAAAPVPVTLSSAPAVEAAPEAEAADSQGFLYGRITTVDGATFEGRMRWGRGQEASWGDYFNGAKRENPWVSYLSPEERPVVHRPLSVFGFKIATWEREVKLDRLLMVRFGDITRIEADSRDVRVTMKSGAVFDLDRLEASDFDDGVRVWAADGSFVDLDSLRIRAIELLPVPARGAGATPSRLHGTVHTGHGDFRGFIQWDRAECLGSDTLEGHTAERTLSVRFDAIRSLSRHADEGTVVTLLDGREVELSGSPKVGPGNRGIYVDDPRYGRVLVSWGAFERLDLAAAGGSAGSGPAYGDFPPGEPLRGRVTTRDGRQLSGRLIYDLDESETTETLDAPAQGVDYTLPFGLVAAIEISELAEPVRVTLHGGEVLQLEPSGDLGERNAGLLVFAGGDESATYVPWPEVAGIDFERPSAMYPPMD